MSPGVISYGMVVFCVLALCVGQILFKAVGLRIGSLADIISNSNIAVLFFGALFLYGVSTVFWVLALRTLPLSRAYPFMALGIVLVPIISHYIFSEPLSLKQFAGLLIVVLGLVVATT